MRILAIPGINTPEEYPFEEEIQEVLQQRLAGFLRGRSLCIERGRWRSTGTISLDIARILNPLSGFAEEETKRLAALLLAFAQSGGRVVLAHSMGTVLVAAAERLAQSGLRFVFIGSPLNHPVWQNALKTRGYNKPMPGELPLNYYNLEDLVCASRILGSRPPAWMESQEVNIPGTHFVQEHDACAYLRNRLVLNGIERALRG